MERGKIRGDSAAGRVEISAHVEFVQMLLGGAWDEVWLRFAIAGGCRARLAVNVKSCLVLRAGSWWFVRFPLVLASRAVAVIIFVERCRNMVGAIGWFWGETRPAVVTI